MLIYKWRKVNLKAEYTRKICFLVLSPLYGCSNYVRGAEWGSNHHCLLPTGEPSKIHLLIELSAIMEMFSICSALSCKGSHKPPVAVELLKCGFCD